MLFYIVLKQYKSYRVVYIFREIHVMVKCKKTEVKLISILNIELFCLFSLFSLRISYIFILAKKETIFNTRSSLHSARNTGDLRVVLIYTDSRV